jgi:hypothetical protein
MKANHSKLWLPLSLLLAMGCGARTPLDDLEPGQSPSPVGGGATSQSGGTSGTSASLGGSLATGGQGGGDSRGGQIATGGRGGSGGTQPPGGTVVGGRGGSGGTQPPGGTVVGGRGGSAGTQPPGGTVVGGRGGSGGTQPFGGTAVGGRGGTAVSSTASGTGAAGSGGTAGTTSCPGLASNEELIDDMNDGDRFIPQVNGRAGAWKDSDDGTLGSTMFPNPAGLFTMTDTGDACRKYAAYVYGGPFVDSGATFGFGIGSPYNASAYTGISFWAKIDNGTSPGLRVAFPDKDTQPDGGLCQAGVSGPTQCWDHYGYHMPLPGLTTQWTRYTIAFSSLTQDGWGRLGAAFDPSTIYEVQFQIPVDGRFGIWVDTVAFTGYFGPTP